MGELEAIHSRKKERLIEAIKKLLKKAEKGELKEVVCYYTDFDDCGFTIQGGDPVILLGLTLRLQWMVNKDGWEESDV